MLRLDDKSALALREYLLAHKGDIALDVNDFGELKIVYYSVFGAEPEDIKWKHIRK